MRKRFGLGFQAVKTDVLGTIEQATGGDKGSSNVGPFAPDLALPAFGGLLPAVERSHAQQPVKTEVQEEAMADEEEL